MSSKDSQGDRTTVLLTISLTRYMHKYLSSSDNSQVNMIADAAPITAKKDEYTGDCASGVAISRVFYKEKRIQYLIVAAEYTQRCAQWLYGTPYIEISHKHSLVQPAFGHVIMRCNI